MCITVSLLAIRELHFHDCHGTDAFTCAYLFAAPRKALSKQYRRECEQLGHEFSICFQHCKYPGNLQESVTSRQRSAIESCNALQENLSALEQSGSYENQVLLRIHHLDID